MGNTKAKCRGDILSNHPFPDQLAMSPTISPSLRSTLIPWQCGPPGYGPTDNPSHRKELRLQPRATKQQFPYTKIIQSEFEKVHKVEVTTRFFPTLDYRKMSFQGLRWVDYTIKYGDNDFRLMQDLMDFGLISPEAKARKKL